MPRTFANTIRLGVGALCCVLTIAAGAQPYPPSKIISKLTWGDEVLKLRPGAGDNWPITWADDDLMITAYGDAETRKKAIERGAEGLLTKPIDFSALRQEIDTRLGQAA